MARGARGSLAFAIDDREHVAELVPFRGEVSAIRRARRDLDRDALHDFESVERNELLWIVGEDPGPAHAEVEEDLHAHAALALVSLEPQAFVGFDRIQTLILQGVRPELVHEPDATPLLPQIKKDAAAFFGEPAEIDRGLGLPGAYEDASVTRLEREDVPGLHDVVRFRFWIGQYLDGLRAVGGADPRRDTLARVDAHGESGAEPCFVARDHLRELELLQSLDGHGHADHAARVLADERDCLRSYELRGHREIAFVLAVLVRSEEDHLSAADVLNSLGDRRERTGWRDHSRSFWNHARHFAHSSSLGACHALLTRRSTYFASTSVSRFTRSPGTSAPSVVRSAVWGMSAISKKVLPRPAIVRDTPSTVMNPFITT